MGTLAQATRRSKTRLRNVAQDAKAMRGRVEAEELESSRAYLAKMVRRLPKRAAIKELLEAVRARWDPPDAEAGEAPTKGSAARDRRDTNPKRELLRQLVLHSKTVHQLAKQLVEQAKRSEEAYVLIVRPARDVVRAPVPTERFTADQASELLGLFLLFITLIERHARRRRSAA